MDIANIMQRIVGKFEENENCGFCWKFVFGGRQDFLNLVKSNDDDMCCALVGVIKNTFTTGYKSNNSFTTKIYKDWNLQIFAGVPSRFDAQFYNEVDQYDICSSRWNKYLYPIQCCMDNLDTTICDTHNCDGCQTTVEIVSWSGEMKLNYLDENFDGWLITATIREWNG